MVLTYCTPLGLNFYFIITNVYPVMTNYKRIYLVPVLFNSKDAVTQQQCAFDFESFLLTSEAMLE